MAEETDRSRAALALSGGGFRATLFHVGALTRLNELGYLRKLERISSVSGGAIAAGVLAHAWPSLTWTGAVATNFAKAVEQPIRQFCKRAIDTRAVGWGALLPGVTIGDVLADIYDTHLDFKGKTLKELEPKPQFVFNATNLQTGRRVHIEKRRLSDYTIGILPDPDIRLATAVAASSAFPPVLSPVTIKTDPQAWQNVPGAVHHGDPHFSSELPLTDGGAYDNLGLETVDSFETVIVADAGAPFSVEGEASSLWHEQALRALDIATDQARSLRKRLLWAQVELANARADGRPKRAAYAGIDTDPGGFPAGMTLTVDPERVAPLARLRTRLDTFSDTEQGQLINWGYVLMDVALRKRIDPNLPNATRWPDPTCRLG